MANVREFLGAQEMQDPFIFDPKCLLVKHFDEMMQYVPTKTERGWVVMVVDPQLALMLLRGAQRDGSGGQSMTSVQVDRSCPIIDEYRNK